MEWVTGTRVAEEGKTVTLKNGATVEVAVASATMGYLRLILEQEPDGQVLLGDLYLIAQGKPDEAGPKGHAFLSGKNLLLSDKPGELLPLARDLLLSSFRRVPDGVVLADPYQSSAENLGPVTDHEASIRDLMRKVLGDGPDASGGGRPGR
jgi:hypothetical protein